MIWFTLALLIIVAVGGYFLWIRPLLKRNPSFAALSDWELDTVQKLQVKFGGIKQKLVTRGVAIAGAAVTAYDFAGPIASAAGFDVTSYEPLTKYVPSSAWPFITMGLLGLVQYFRNVSDSPQKSADEVD